MNEDSNFIRVFFVATVILTNILSVIGCLILIYFRLSASGVEHNFLTGARRFVLVAGAFSSLMMAGLYLKGLSADRYSGMTLLGSIPYFAPMAISGLISIFLKR